MKYYSLAIFLLLQSSQLVSAKHHLKHQSARSNNFEELDEPIQRHHHVHA
jgi:hypothetical protein